MAHLSLGGGGLVDTSTFSWTGVWVWCCCSSRRRTSVTMPGTSSSGRGSTSAITCRGSRNDLAVAISARNGPGDGHIQLQRDLLEQAADDLRRAGLAEADAVDRQPGREFAGEVAVEPDDHRRKRRSLQRVEGDVAHHAEVRLVDHAVVGERRRRARGNRAGRRRSGRRSRRRSSAGRRRTCRSRRFP